MGALGTLTWAPPSADVLAAPVATALAGWARADEVRAAAIDPELADTAEFCEHYGIDPQDSANCVVIAGKRGGEVRYAACLVLATDRADVNGAIRRRMDVRKASFAPMDDAVGLTGMEYGGITPIGLPGQWPVLVDQNVIGRSFVVIGSGVRRSKLALSGKDLAAAVNAEILALTR